MKPARHITLWLAAVIVMVAAVLMPSGARAHGEHGHHGGQAGSVSMTETVTPHADSAVVETSSVVSEAVLSAGPHAVCSGCPSGSHAPSSCCATGLLPSAAPWPTRPTVSGRATARDGPRLCGIVPEAQAEPPRPFA